LHAGTLSKCFRFEATQTTSFSSPTQDYFIQNANRPDYLPIVFPDLVASYMGLHNKAIRVSFQEFYASCKEITCKRELIVQRSLK
jgi:hypothetical protein